MLFLLEADNTFNSAVADCPFENSTFSFLILPLFVYCFSVPAYPLIMRRLWIFCFPGRLSLIHSPIPSPEAFSLQHEELSDNTLLAL